MNKIEFLEEVKIIKYNQPYLRKGQIIFNLALEYFKVSTYTLINSKVDCFKDDSKIEEFLKVLSNKKVLI